MKYRFLELLYPQQQLDSIFDLDTAALRSRGIRGIIADMDNTLVPWYDRTVYPRLASWLARLKEEGFRLCIVSNNTRERGESWLWSWVSRRSGTRSSRAGELFAGPCRSWI